jgi:hypothetical protein
VASVREDLAYVVERYASSPSFTPVYYVYDSYHTQPEEWARLLTPGKLTVAPAGPQHHRLASHTRPDDAHLWRFGTIL